MKTKFLFILLGAMITGSVIFTLTSAYGVCLIDQESGKPIEPCKGLPYPSTASLKQQIEQKTSITEITCPNPEHVLTQRPNSNLACIFPETQEKLNWQIIYYMIK
ncbi:MAG: hypothetical protein ACW9W4_01030 [Candidatus Nitrosopumilus sp. bin_7KS]